MKSQHLRFKNAFHVSIGNRRSQSAEMVLSPGETQGGPGNRHRGSDQWLFIVDGTGAAIVDGTRYRLRTGTILLIERGYSHEIRNTGKIPLRTLSVYVPPAYKKNGDPLPAGKE